MALGWIGNSNLLTRMDEGMVSLLIFPSCFRPWRILHHTYYFVILLIMLALVPPRRIKTRASVNILFISVATYYWCFSSLL